MCTSKPKAPPPTAAPVVQTTPDTAEGKAAAVENTEEGFRKRKRDGRTSLRIDANITGDGGAGGNGLNIPR